jgi:hypothetical protein
MADLWALYPLAVKVAPIAGGSRLSVALGTPHMILGVVHKWSSLHLFGSINSGVPGVDYLIPAFHSFL